MPRKRLPEVFGPLRGQTGDKDPEKMRAARVFRKQASTRSAPSAKDTISALVSNSVGA